MKKILFALLLATLGGCATGGVQWAPQSGRDVLTPRDIGPFSRQHVVLLVSNECAPAIAVFTIDHTTLATATIILQDSSHTVEIDRPRGAGDSDYWLRATVKAYDADGVEIGEVSYGPWGVETHRSGYQETVTVADNLSRPSGAVCPKKARRR